MIRPSRSRLLAAISVALACLLAARPAASQTLTTGTISGTVVDQQGGVLPGVSVTAVHEPTGTTYDAVTGGDGRFQIPNVKVGGPYTVTATLSGFRDEKSSNIVVNLGEDRAVEFKLALSGLAETVNVSAERPAIDETRAGTASNVPLGAIEQLPTITRSLTDMARTSPYFNEQNSNGGDSFLSVAGRNNRYNNIQIDGAVNNDLFGLAASGTPGGQTGTQPISLDAIQELQLVVAPYDVRQGGFSGGGINAITRSGTNEYHGTGYWFGRSQGLVGTIPSVNAPNGDTKVGKFKDQQGGFSLGGPIVHNTAFFFGNLDLGRRDTPNGFSVGGSGQDFGHAAEVNRVVSILKNQYGYDPGGTDEFSKRQNSDKVFVRADFNLSARNQLTVRNNYVNGIADQSGTTPSSLIYILPGNFYAITDKLTSTVGQLNSTFSNSYNELRVTYQRERNKRDPGTPFPHLQIDLADGSNVRAGSELSSQANALNQDIVELTDDLTMLKGTHTLTIGTHNELFKFLDVFVQNYFGQYRFSSVDNLAAGIAGSFNHNFSNDPSNPTLPAEFAVYQFGFYAGDQWRVRNDLTLTYGIRFDLPQFPDKPHANPLSVASYGFATDVTPSPKMISPRFGFNWDVSKGAEQRKQVRGGIGIFAGRTPYVWLANQYSNTGVDFTALQIPFRATNTIKFVADPNAQPTSVAGATAGNQTINLIDPDYQFPTVIRGNLAYDHQLPFWGLIGTAEGLFASNLKEIKYQNLNYVQIGTRSDGRPVYTRKVSSVNDALLLTNTTEGGQWSLSYKVDRPFRNGFFVSGSYIYGRAKSIMDGTSSVALSNWGGTYIGGDINNPPLRPSDFEVRHRVSLSTTVPIPLGHGIRSTASLYYNGQSGRPYSVVFNGDANGDNRTTNDLIFVPSSPDQVNVINGTWAQLDAFLNSLDATSGYRGQIEPRNSGQSPWTNTTSFRYAVDLPTGRSTRVELTMDIFNLLNLLNSNWGWAYYPNFGGPTVIGFAGADRSGKMTYNLNTITSPTFHFFTRDDLRSRWQAQWGARIRF